MMKPATEKRLTPVEKYEEAALELALYSLLMEERDKALKPLDEETEKQLKAQYERSLPKRMAMINRHTRQQALKTNMKNCMARVLMVAAVIIVLANISLTIAVASSSAVRAYVLEFFVKVNDSYAEIGFVNTDMTLEIPEGWTGSCYPAYIPEGFEIIQTVLSNAMDLVLMQGPNNRELSFAVYSNDVSMNIDAENAEISFITVQGINATVFNKDGVVTLIWPYGDQIIELYMSGSLNEVMLVAESIRVIKN